MAEFETVRSPDTAEFRAAVQAQAEAADPLRPAWVAANAGSGKTKVLIDRVARLLLRGAAPDSILCITYTRAAANEMMSRLFARLGAWSVEPADELRRQLARLEDRPPDSYDEAGLRRARALFAQALETPGGLRIETIHAFCGRVLRRFPLEAGLPPGFREIDDIEAGRLWTDACREALAQVAQSAPDALTLATREGGVDGAAVALNEAKGHAGWLRRFAGAHGHDLQAMVATLRKKLGASGETPDGILERVMDRDLPAEALRSLLPALADGKKSDIELLEFITETLAEPTVRARWEKYKRVAFTKSGDLRTRNPFTKAMGDRAPLLSELFEVSDGEGREIARLRTARDEHRAAEALQRTTAFLTLGVAAVRQYDAAKRARAALDFDDLIDRAKALLSDSAQSAWVLYKLDGGLSHVLLDEAQDTSPDQWDLLNALTAEMQAGEGAERRDDPRTLFVVGDEKQSIFSFQGAAPDRFLSERQAFAQRVPDGRTPDMAMSFRSSPEILTFVDTVFDTSVFDGHPFAQSPPPEADAMRHLARRENQPGQVELWPLTEPEAPDTPDPWDAPLDTLTEHSPKARLAAAVAADIARRIAVGETIWEEAADRTWTRRPLQAGDVLILVRKRGGLFDALIQALKREGLPVAGADRLVLSAHLGVQDCLNLMRFALLPEDDLTLAEILRGPFAGLVDDDRHLFPLAYGRGRQSLWARLRASRDPEHVAVADWLDGVIARRGTTPFAFLTHMLTSPGVGGLTGWQALIRRLGSPVRDPVEALSARAMGLEGQGPATLQAFLSAMDADTSQIKRDLASADGKVRVMTVHGAKGLQAPLVFLPDTTAKAETRTPACLGLDGVPVWAPRSADDTASLAAARAEAAADALREHRRLLYVALTRAQDRLVVAGAWHGRATGQGRENDSWYALCEAAMDRLEASEAPGRPGVRLLGQPAPRGVAGERRDGERPAPEWLRRPAPSEEGRTTRILAPAALSPETGPVLAPGRGARAERLARGQAIHGLLERLPGVAEADREAVMARYLARHAHLDEPMRAEIRETVRRTLAAPDLAGLFGQAARAEVPVIGRGPDWPAGFVVNGRVDRLLVTQDTVWIADIKTDRPPPADPDGLPEAYWRQMAAYRSVLAAAYPDRAVRCGILWTDGPIWMPLPEAGLLAALNRTLSAL